MNIYSQQDKQKLREYLKSYREVKKISLCFLYNIEDA